MHTYYNYNTDNYSKHLFLHTVDFFNESFISTKSLKTIICKTFTLF